MGHHVDIDGDEANIVIDGDLDTLEAAELLEDAVGGAFESGLRVLRLDLSKVGHITAPGLESIVRVNRLLRRNGGGLRVTGLSPFLEAFFDALMLNLVVRIDRGSKAA